MNEDATVRGSAEDAEITEQASRVLRCALERRGPAGDGDLRKALRATCALARGRGVRAEELLVVLKRTWRELPEVRSRTREEADAALGRVITLCIREYYGPERDPE